MARKSKKIKSSKALVKYDNKFNESSLSSLNPIEIKLLHAIISQIKDQGTSEVVIPFENLKYSFISNMPIPQFLRQDKLLIQAISLSLKTR